MVRKAAMELGYEPNLPDRRGYARQNGVPATAMPPAMAFFGSNTIFVLGFIEAEVSPVLPPPLTTVRYLARAIGAPAVECLVPLIHARETSTPSLVLSSQQGVRDRCAPPAPDAAH